MRHTVTPPGMLLLAERQMRIWELAHTMGEPRIVEPPPVKDFVALSREAGLDVSDIAQSLGRRLGWPVHDHEVLEAMARGDRRRLHEYEFLDQRDRTWLEEIALALGTTEYRWNEHFHCLSRTVVSLAAKTNAVFVGRAADLILPRARGLRVRITASRDFAIRLHAESRALSIEVAAREVDRIRAAREEFIRRHFAEDPQAPGRHDLVVNRETFTPDEAVDLIVAALRARGISS